MAIDATCKLTVWYWNCLRQQLKWTSCCRKRDMTWVALHVKRVKNLTGKSPILSCRSSTSFTSRHIFLLVGACHAPASTFRPGRQGRTLLANCRQSGHVNSPLSTENPWRTWSFWVGTNKQKKTHKCQYSFCFEIKTNFFIPVYPQRFHVRLVTVNMKGVSTGLNIDSSVPAYGHGLQTGTLQHLQEKDVGELQDANMAERHLQSFDVHLWRTSAWGWAWGHSQLHTCQQRRYVLHHLSGASWLLHFCSGVPALPITRQWPKKPSRWIFKLPESQVAVV